MLGLLMLVELENERKKPSTDCVNQGSKGKFLTPSQMVGMLWQNRERLVTLMNGYVRYHHILGAILAWTDL